MHASDLAVSRIGIGITRLYRGQIRTLLGNNFTLESPRCRREFNLIPLVRLVAMEHGSATVCLDEKIVRTCYALYVEASGFARRIAVTHELGWLLHFQYNSIK